MMMMAELVQGQASVAQAGMKDGFTDPFHRARQVRDASDRCVWRASVCVRERASGLSAFSLLAASAAGALKLQIKAQQP